MPLHELWAAAQPSLIGSTSCCSSDSSDSDVQTQTWKVLTVKAIYLARILCGDKLWEIRKTSCSYRGKVALAAAGTNKLWGTAVVSSCFRKSEAELEAAFEKHCVPADLLRKFCHKGKGDAAEQSWAYIWELEQPRLFREPLDFKHKKGCVIWTLPSRHTIKQIEARTVCAEDSRDAEHLLKSMRLCRCQQRGQKRKGRFKVSAHLGS